MLKIQDLTLKMMKFEALIGHSVFEHTTLYMYQYPDIGAWVASVNISSGTSTHVCVRLTETCLPLTTGQLLGDLRP